MKVDLIGNSNCANSTQRGQQSFGHIALTRAYRRQIRWWNSPKPVILPSHLRKKASSELLKELEEPINSDLEEVKKLAEKTIDLKKILGYDNLNPRLKKVFDKFLAVMSEKEINDLTVELGVDNSMHGYVSATCIGPTWARYKDDIHLIVKLPVMNPRNGKIRYRIVDMGEKLYTGEIAESLQNRSIKTIHKEKLDNNGFKYGYGSESFSHNAVPIPAEKIFDVIGNKIKEHFSELLKLRNRIMKNQEINDFLLK